MGTGKLKQTAQNEGMQKERIRSFVESQGFQVFIAGVIFVNAVTIGCETLETPETMRAVLGAVDLVCLGVYIIEAALKLHVYGKDYFKDGWNVFDFLIIVLSLVAIALTLFTLAVSIPIQVARTIRMFRVVRVFKLLAVFRKLRVIIEAIGRSIPSVLWTCLLLLIVLYVFDVLGVFAFSRDFPLYFGDLAAGLLTLFQVLTLEGWPEIARPIIMMYPFAWLYFVPFIVLTAFIMLNIILGIILDTIDESRQAERVEPGATNVQLAAELEELKAQIDTVQRLLDKANAEKDREK